MNINDNVKLQAGGKFVCNHCDQELGSADGDPLGLAIRRERAASEAGPGIRAPATHFTDRPIGLRQSFCPKCYVLLTTEVAPTDEPLFRRWELTAS